MKRLRLQGNGLLHLRNWFWNRMERLFNCPSMDAHKVFAILIPLVVDQGFVVLLNLLNTAMISSSGVEAVSAVNMVDSLNMFLVSVFIAVATGGTVVVAQYRGAGEEAMVTKSAAQALTAVTFLGILLGGLIIIFHQPVLSVLFGKAEALVMENATLYLIGSCATYPLFAFYQAIVGSLRGVGDSKASLYLSLILNGSYVVLNLLFVTLLNWGIVGLLVSLVISRLLGAAVAMFYMMYRTQSLQISKEDIVKLDLSFQKRILLIGLPFAAEQMFFNGGKILTQTFIVQLGTYAMTANAIAATFLGVMQITGNAMGLAVITMVGQCMGQKQVEDAKKLTKSGILFAMITMTILSLVVLALFYPLLSLFSPPQEIVETIFIMVLLNVIVQPFGWCISFTLPSALRAAGDAKFTSIASMCSMWIVRVILGYILGITLNFGIIGVWCAMYFEWFIRGGIFLLRFRGKKWYQHQLI